MTKFATCSDPTNPKALAAFYEKLTGRKLSGAEREAMARELGEKLGRKSAAASREPRLRGSKR